MSQAEPEFTRCLTTQVNYISNVTKRSSCHCLCFNLIKNNNSYMPCVFSTSVDSLGGSDAGAHPICMTSFNIQAVQRIRSVQFSCHSRSHLFLHHFSYERALHLSPSLAASPPGLCIWLSSITPFHLRLWSEHTAGRH